MTHCCKISTLLDNTHRRSHISGKTRTQNVSSNTRFSKNSASKIGAKKKFNVERSFPRNKKFLSDTYFLYFIYSAGKFVWKAYFFREFELTRASPFGTHARIPLVSLYLRLSLTREQKIDYPSCVSQRIALDWQVCRPLSVDSSTVLQHRCRITRDRPLGRECLPRYCCLQPMKRP